MLFFYSVYWLLNLIGIYYIWKVSTYSKTGSWGMKCDHSVSVYLFQVLPKRVQTSVKHDRHTNTRCTNVIISGWSCAREWLQQKRNTVAKTLYIFHNLKWRQFGMGVLGWVSKFKRLGGPTSPTRGCNGGLRLLWCRTRPLRKHPYVSSVGETRIRKRYTTECLNRSSCLPLRHISHSDLYGYCDCPPKAEQNVIVDWWQPRLRANAHDTETSAL